MNFGERVETVLKQKNISRKAFAIDIKVSYPCISNWKMTGTIPSADIAIRIAKYLEVDLNWLVFGD